MMSEQRAWTIGAASECDVVVADATVSGRHCRLTRNDDGFLLEDLGSTNGTFVNGTLLTAPLSVSSADEIKLGPGVVFPWDVIDPAAAQDRVIRIGRQPDNDIVLDYPNVSGHHARIVIKDGLTTIEDLGSTNGIAIGRPDNMVTTAGLTKADTVFFGSMSVSAADLLDPKRTAVGAKIAVNMLPPGGGVLKSRKSTVIAAGCVLAVAIVVAVAVMLSGGNQDGNGEQPPPTNGHSDETDVPVIVTSTIAENPHEAIYSVLVQDQKNDQLFRIGTAWAISEHQLVTSGSIAMVIEKIRDDFPIVQVRNAALDKVFIVNRSVAHDDYELAVTDADSARRKAESKREELEKLNPKAGLANEKPPAKEVVDKLIKLDKQFVQHQEDRYLAVDRQTFFDVGLLTVEESLPKVLAVSDFSQKLAVQSSLTLSGVSFEHDQMVFFETIEPSQLTGSLKRMVGPPKKTGEKLERLLIGSPAGHQTKNWLGSPVLNADGRVVAVYSRSTLPDDPSKPITGTSFDATPIGQIRALPVIFPEIQK